MKKAKTNYVGALALLLIGAGGVFAIGSYIKSNPDAQHVPANVRRPEPSKQHENRPAPDVEVTTNHETERERVLVLTPESKDGNLTFTSKMETVPSSQKPIVFAVNRYLENTGFVDKKAKALSVDIHDRVAHIDVTEAFETSYGSSDEQTVLQGLQKTMGQFTDIDKFAFYVSGKQVTSLGNADLTDPIEVIKAGEDSKQNGA